MPSDLSIYISENHANVTEQNATWTWRNPHASFTIYPRDQNIQNAKKASDQDKRRFLQLYLVFETGQEDSEFKLQVTFPENEELELRRKMMQGDPDAMFEDSEMMSSYR